MASRENPVALLTGAAKRVGATIARHLHREGFDLTIHYRSSDEEAEALRDELVHERPSSVQLLRAELLDEDAPERLVRATLEHWKRLDLLVNNASLFYATKFGEVTRAQWDELIGINLRVPFFLAQEAAEALRESSGAVVNIVDIYAERPLKAFPVYSVAKAGLAMMTKSLARELGPAVRVNAIAPGAILWPDQGTSDKTQQKIIARTALKRQGSPEDLAKAVLYLARDADYVTGQTITVDGGRTLTN